MRSPRDPGEVGSHPLAGQRSESHGLPFLGLPHLGRVSDP